ncbi:MAG: hypothetical protein ACI8S6_005122 [Myxococcota bacterium]|jgi:hypothetical protein
MVMWSWLLLGCGSGSEDPSLIDSLQIVGIVANPPEVVARDQMEVTLAIADPVGTGAEVLVASCLLFESRCVEEVLANPSEWLSVAALDPGETSLTIPRSVPSELDEVFDVFNQEQVSVRLAGLACAPSRCPIIDEVRDALDAGVVPTSLALDIARPERWMVDLPIEGVSLTSRSLVFVRTRDSSSNRNPTYEARFPERDDLVIEIPAGGEQELAFYVEDSGSSTIYAYAYTTLGRFESRRERVRDQAVRHYLLADTPGEGHIYIVFEDGDGGSAIWQRPLRVL